MLDAKMKSIGLGQQVGAPVATAHELLSRCSGGKGLSGIVPTSRTPQPALALRLARFFCDSRSRSAASLMTRQAIG